MIKKHSILLILLLLSFGFPEIIISSSASYYFRTLGINDGLSQSTVNAILQDRKGFMWIGTKDGLNQYDGQVFRTFQKENSSLGNNFITALYEDCDGDIWVGTDAGVYIYNPVQEAFQLLETEITSLGEKIMRSVTWITSDLQNNIWIRGIKRIIGQQVLHGITECLRTLRIQRIGYQTCKYYVSSG